MLPETLPRTLYAPKNEQLKISEKQVKLLLSSLRGNSDYFAESVYEDMKLAILNEEIIGAEFDNKCGSLYKRIQKWLWNNHGFNYSCKKGETTDLLEKQIQILREDTLVFPVETELQKLADWNAGDFGDEGSCYWASNATTRRFLNVQPNFRALKVYKEGKGYGRALILSDIAGPDFSLLYNSYPGHSSAKFQELFAHALVENLGKNTGGEYGCKAVDIENRSTGSWFYTNAKLGMMVYPLSQKKKADGTNTVAVSFGTKPKVRTIEGYIGDCLNCTVPEEEGAKRGIPIFYYDKYKEFPGGKKPAGICQTCCAPRQNCAKCNRKVPILRGLVFNVFDAPEFGVYVQEIASQANIYVCHSCFSKNIAGYTYND